MNGGDKGGRGSEDNQKMNRTITGSNVQNMKLFRVAVVWLVA